MRYRDAEEPLPDLLRAFGPVHETTPLNSFWYARNDQRVLE